MGELAQAKSGPNVHSVEVIRAATARPIVSQVPERGSALPLVKRLECPSPSATMSVIDFTFHVRIDSLDNSF